jgi:hypothetical protein
MFLKHERQTEKKMISWRGEEEYQISYNGAGNFRAGKFLNSSGSRKKSQCFSIQ